MPLFAYTARSQSGAFVAGSLQSENADSALAHLRMRTLFVTALQPAQTAKGLVAGAFTFLPVNAAARLACFRSLATLVRSGVPLRRALQITIDECPDRRFSEALRSVASDIEAGSSLSSAMARRPREFSELFIAMIRAGELAGVLDEVLERLASLLESDRAMRKRLASALAYPAIVCVAALALVLFLVANIVPAFAGLFKEMHVDLPLSTRVMIAMSDALGKPATAIALLGVGLGAYVAFRMSWGSERLGRQLDRAVLGSPVIGMLLRRATIARLARTLGTLLKSGVALLVALDATEGTLGHMIYADVLRNVGDRLRGGYPFAEPLEKSGLFDALFLQLVHVGEETGTLDSMLLRIAEYLELEIETGIATIGSVVEPAIMIFLGAVVGTIVASVLLPLYSIIGSIK